MKTLRDFMSDKRADIPQVLLLIGLIAIPIALFLSSMGNEVRDNTKSNASVLMDAQSDLKEYDN